MEIFNLKCYFSWGHFYCRFLSKLDTIRDNNNYLIIETILSESSDLILNVLDNLQYMTTQCCDAYTVFLVYHTLLLYVDYLQSKCS